MSPEKQRIAIAEACGWDFDPSQAREWGSRGKWVSAPNGAPSLVFKHSIPDYPNDISAMFRAFGKLGRHWEIKQAEDGYVCRIQFGRSNADITVAGLELAPVMVEAFLRTVGKWEVGE